MKKDVLCMAIGTLATGLFGSWGPLYYALLVCQAIDLVAGLMVAGVFNKSNKSENGRIDSAAMFKGLCRKFAMWAVIAVAHQIDIVLGVNYITTASVYAFMANEAVSVIENAGQMGVVKSQVLINAIDVLKSRADKQQ